MWWKILLGYLVIHIGIGLVIGSRMFDYPVGTFWHVMVALFWPILLVFQ